MTGHSSVKFVLQDGSPAGKEIELTLPETVIGRDAGADLVIDSPAVSRRHARIARTNGQIRVEDLGSSNGTFVNGVRLTAPQVLRPGDLVQLGRAVSLTFVAPDGDARHLAGPQQETREEARPAAQGMTVLAGSLPPAAVGMPPRLVVTVAGAEPQRDASGCSLRARWPREDAVLRSRICTG